MIKESKLHTVLNYALIIMTTTLLSSCIAMHTAKTSVKKELKKQANSIQEKSSEFFKKIEWNGHTWIILITEDGIGLAHDPDCPCLQKE